MTDNQNTNSAANLAANATSGKPTSVSFLGLGAMGYPMASHLVGHFDSVMVWNRSADKAHAHAKEFGSHAVDFEQALSANIIISCLPTSQQVAELIERAKLHLRVGSVWVDCTSGVPDAAHKAAATLEELGCYFIDAPVSGQTTGAIAGSLTVMVGGDTDALAYAKPAINCFAGLIEHVGSSGGGFAVKAVNNTLFAVNSWALGEGLGVLKAHGVKPSSALECINHSSGQSFASKVTFPDRIVNRSFPKTFTLDLMAKDCGIAIDLQQQAKLPAPVMAAVASFMRAASNQVPAGSADFSEFIHFLENWTNQMISDDLDENNASK
ncbi:NAD(P)-dependent oxidoreductase [Psychrobacter urativorans]|uniref:NAD(P)-dependent oxidoreductase n=1 Tax=Psychrobacter urativorans TaxID=45610 RepID=UPI00191B0E9F|nr:NAD(P)-dependent oxidoreductase [Psychrobacter urativorans]